MSDISAVLKMLEIGAEGGSITVLTRCGEKSNQQYSVRLRDQSLTFLSPAEADNEIRRDTAWTEDWGRLIKALSRWSWPMLGPVYIQPDFTDRVMAAVKNYRGMDGRPASARGIERWREACREKL